VVVVFLGFVGIGEIVDHHPLNFFRRGCCFFGFVGIGEIVDHHSLNFLFINLNYLFFLTF